MFNVQTMAAIAIQNAHKMWPTSGLYNPTIVYEMTQYVTDIRKSTYIVYILGQFGILRLRLCASCYTMPTVHASVQPTTEEAIASVQRKGEGNDTD